MSHTVTNAFVLFSNKEIALAPLCEIHNIIVCYVSTHGSQLTQWDVCYSM